MPYTSKRSDRLPEYKRSDRLLERKRSARLLGFASGGGRVRRRGGRVRRQNSKLTAALALATAATLAVLPTEAIAGSGGIDTVGSDAPVGPAATLVDGRAIAPVGAPPMVVRAIEAANRIVDGRPYCLGGGHAAWQSRCYDCSGAVSYALGKPGARIVDTPMPSGEYMNWGARGPGEWITVYANGGHVYAVIAGLRLDTSMTDGEGPGWSTLRRSPKAFTVRHPIGF